MLRASAHATGQPVDLRAIIDRTADPLIEAGAGLLAFVTALIGGDMSNLDATRTALRDAAGSHAVVRAAAVAGNFQMMNRLVDATGVPIGPSMRSIAADLGLDEADLA
jgi:hypothetical protein